MRARGARRVEDGVEVVIDAGEQDALRSIPPQLRAIVEAEEPTPAAEQIRRRLFPAAYDDDALDAEYRDLAHADLAEGRIDALDTFLRTLDEGHRRGRRWEIQLSGEEAEAWLAVINDARLVLASVVGITDESVWERGPDHDDPASVMLFYLGWLEEELVGALSSSLDDEPPSP